ncbi:MAG: hypothetical protein HBSIN02_18660 [Bacteroidia bacterium]|nr:MAG: hypothetical protein HBSIN02_18660 [Bacteroidia bacterium]
MNTTTSHAKTFTSGEAVQSRPRTLESSIATTWTVLRLTFGLVPVVAGLDKFTNLLTNWESYLNPAFANILPLSGQVFMGVVGVIEIAAGILVLARPRIGGFVVMGWLIAIALSLIASGQYLDVAVRDVVMAIGAFTLASLSASDVQSRLTTAKSYAS